MCERWRSNIRILLQQIIYYVGTIDDDKIWCVIVWQMALWQPKKLADNFPAFCFFLRLLNRRRRTPIRTTGGDVTRLVYTAYTRIIICNRLCAKGATAELNSDLGRIILLYFRLLWLVARVYDPQKLFWRPKNKSVQIHVILILTRRKRRIVRNLRKIFRIYYLHNITFRVCERRNVVESCTVQYKICDKTPDWVRI